jgi:hypothetical protein
MNIANTEQHHLKDVKDGYLLFQIIQKISSIEENQRDLIVTNCVYWRRVSGAIKWIFTTIKSTIDVVKISNTIQLFPF